MATITVVAAARGGQQQPLPLPDTQSPQQLRKWVIQRARPGGGGFGFLRTAQRRQQSHQETFSPQLLSELFSQQCVPETESITALGARESATAPGASESAAALGACASPATGPASGEALHTFTLDSGVSRCFFCDCTTLTPLAAPVLVSLADLIGGPVVARASTVLPCSVLPSGSLSGLHLSTFLTNMVSNAAIQDVWVDTLIPGGQRVAICTCSRTGRHLATFTRRPGSSLYTLTTASAQVAESGQVALLSQVSVSGQLAASCSCQVLSHKTLLWHHHLGHPSLPRLRSMHSRLLVWPSQRAAPHSSEFSPTTAPLQTLHMDVWGPAPVGGTDQERYFLLVVGDYTRYTNVFPLWRKADISGVLTPWIRATCHPLRERFCWDFPVLCLHSDRGGEFSSDLLTELCRKEGICQTFMLPASPQQNGIAERRIGLIMEVARTSMIHAAAPHFLRPFAVQYAAHQLNPWPCVSEPETSSTLRWTGKVGDASVFRVWGALSLVRDAKASKLSSRTLRCVFLGFPIDAPPWQFYHPRSRPVFSSQDVTPLTSLSVSTGYTRTRPTRWGGDPAADDTAATRRSPRLETPLGFLPRSSSPPLKPAAVDSGAENAGAVPWGAETKGEGSGGAATGGARFVGAATGGAVSPSGGGAVGDPARGKFGGGGHGPAGTGAASTGAASPGGTAGAGGAGGTAGGAGAAGTRGAGAGGARGTAGAGGAGAGGIGVAGAAGPGGARTGGTGAAGAGGAAGARDAGAADARGTGGVGAAGPRGASTRGVGAARAGGAAGAIGAGGAAGAVGNRGAGGNAGARGAGAAGARGAAGAGGAGIALRRPFFYLQTQSSLPPPDLVLRQVLSLPSSTGLTPPLLCPSIDQSQPKLLPGSPLPAPDPHTKRVVLLEPPASSLPYVPNPKSDLAHAASPTVTRLLTTVVTDPGVESTALFAPVSELVDFAARSRLDYAASLVTESESVCPPSVGGEPALSNDVLEDRQFELECLATALLCFASMLLFLEGDPGVEFFQTFSPTLKMTTLRVLLHVAAYRD
ncbi:unnamed protein product [Closterium sp. NIES-54]